MGNTTRRCEAPTSEIDHDAPSIFGTTAYVQCGKPAAWFVETDRHDLDMCERHATDALLYEGARSVTDADGEPLVVS